MYRNTFTLILFLAVIAALVVGVRIGSRNTGGNFTSQPVAEPEPLETPIPTTLPAKTYTNATCGFTFQYPGELTEMPAATASSFLVHNDYPEQSILIVCQEDIPPVTNAYKSVRTIPIPHADGTSSVSAKLYEGVLQDHVLMDDLVFANPLSGMEAFIVASSSAMAQVISTLILIK